jgi:hypothetical protein
MTLPISGPFNRTDRWYSHTFPSGYRAQWGFESRTWYRQRKPYNLPLTYGHARAVVIPLSEAAMGTEYYMPLAYLVRNDFSWLQEVARNKAYSRFLDKIKPDQAELGAALAERKQSMEMIANRSLQLLRFVRAVKKFRFGEAAKVLGLSSVPKGVRAKGRAFASNVLEYSFGWAPMIGDIGNAINVLQSGVPPLAAKGRAKEQTQGVGFWMEGVNRHDYDLTVYAMVHYGAKVQVNNPNLFLANQLGLVNPASVLWEVVPFSFVVDYFVNVNKFLASFTDFWGVDLIDPYTTLGILSQSDEMLSGPTTSFQRFVGYSYSRNRQPGPIPGPTLRRAPWKLSPQRALTSVALLLQQLGKR